MIVHWGAQPLVSATLSCKLIHLAVDSSVSTVISFIYDVVPSEHAVISKERRSGVYHLSAYYLAKTVSELPLVLVQPSLYFIVTYWSVGLNGVVSFFGSLFIVVVNAVVGQVNSSKIYFFM